MFCVDETHMSTTCNRINFKLENRSLCSSFSTSWTLGQTLKSWKRIISSLQYILYLSVSKWASRIFFNHDFRGALYRLDDAFVSAEQIIVTIAYGRVWSLSFRTSTPNTTSKSRFICYYISYLSHIKILLLKSPSLFSSPVATFIHSSTHTNLSYRIRLNIALISKDNDPTWPSEIVARGRPTRPLEHS